MCGIIGYTGHRPGVPVVLEGLHFLEYRGYDSSGIGFVQNHNLHIIRASGKIEELEKKLSGTDTNLATTVIGHTRWATHGAPTENNAHPHRAFAGDICIVHNGIIENYQELKNELLEKGVTFTSQTDTEVLVNCIQEERKTAKTLLEAFSAALKKAHGAYAVTLLSKDEPDVIYAARHSAPLLLGVGVGENFIASDIPAFLSYTKNVVFLEDGEIVVATPTSWKVLSIETLAPIDREVQHIDWDIQSAQKGGYRHFMLKEIYEQPRVIIDCMAGRVRPDLEGITLPEIEHLAPPKRVRIIACGTSYNAGVWAAPLFEELAGAPCTVEIASEFRYRKPLLEKDEIVFALSQSGETADTLAAVHVAQKAGCKVIGICNAIGSSIARESDAVLYTQAGPEVSVASTKALSSQMVLLTLVAALWGTKKQVLSTERLRELLHGLSTMPSLIESLLPSMQAEAKKLTRKYSGVKGMFFLGRGQSFPLALEGALKVKELSYIHAEGYASGEMKHGPIALIEPDFLSFFVAPHDDVFSKSKSNLEEVMARGGPVVVLTNPQKPGFETNADHVWTIPDAKGQLATLLMLPALQLFSYEMSTCLGNDVDQPRNLAKSVTVE